MTGEDTWPPEKKSREAPAEELSCVALCRRHPSARLRSLPAAWQKWLPKALEKAEASPRGVEIRVNELSSDALLFESSGLGLETWLLCCKAGTL